MKNFETDTEMLVALQQGESAAFDQVYGLFFRPLCYFAEKITGSSAVAEDIATESFVKLLRKSPDFETLTSLKSFLYTSTRNGSFDHLRAQKRHASSHQQIRYLASYSEEEIENNIIKAEVLSAVYTAINTLPEKCRNIVRLALVEGKDNEEIAAETGMAYQTIRNNKSEGIKLLRIQLYKDGDLSHSILVLCLLYLNQNS